MSREDNHLRRARFWGLSHNRPYRGIQQRSAMKLFAALFLVILAGCRTFAGDPDASPLVKARDVYNNNVAKIEKEYSEQRSALPKKYNETLSGLEQSYREAGNPEGVLAVRKERERFASIGEVMLTDVVKEPHNLRIAQEQFLKLPENIDADKNEKLRSVTTVYRRALEQQR